MKTAIDQKEISFVVQGGISAKHTTVCIKSIRKFFPNSQIIVSTWEGSDVSELDYDKVVFSKDPGGFVYNKNKKFYNNVNRQIVSTLNGLKEVETKYAAKIRSDMVIFSNRFVKHFYKYPKRNDRMKLFKNRIIIYSFTSKFRLGAEIMPFCVSDWFYFGNTSDLIMLFDIPLSPSDDDLYFDNGFPDNAPKDEWFYPTPLRYAPEQYIAYSKISQIMPNINFNHRFCNDEKIISISNLFIANNFLSLCHHQLPLYLQKKERCEYFGSSYDYWLYVITFFRWEALYKKYCDSSHRIKAIRRKMYHFWIKIIYKSKKVQNALRKFYKWKIRGIMNEK